MSAGVGAKTLIFRVFIAQEFGSSFALCFAVRSSSSFVLPDAMLLIIDVVPMFRGGGHDRVRIVKEHNAI